MSFIGTLLRNTRLSRQATNAVKSRTAEAIGNVRNVQRSSTALVEQSAATRTVMGDALSGLEKAGSAATMGGQFARAGLAAAGAGPGGRGLSLQGADDLPVHGRHAGT